MVLALSLMACSESKPQPDQLDRGMAALQMQTLSDFVGFEAVFTVAPNGTTLIMSGSPLCGDDFGQLVPPAWWTNVRAAGFTRFECSDGAGARRVTAAFAI
jgi:hypothetical protein